MGSRWARISKRARELGPLSLIGDRRLESSADDGRPMILDGRDLTPWPWTWR